MVLRRDYEIREADGCARTPPGAMLRRPFCYCCSFMYVAVFDINYTAESVVLGEGKRLGSENVGLKYPVWLLHNNDRRCNMLRQ